MTLDEAKRTAAVCLYAFGELKEPEKLETPTDSFYLNNVRFSGNLLSYTDPRAGDVVATKSGSEVEVRFKGESRAVEVPIRSSGTARSRAGSFNFTVSGRMMITGSDTYKVY